jgi:hypothetical protein
VSLSVTASSGFVGSRTQITLVASAGPKHGSRIPSHRQAPGRATAIDGAQQIPSTKVAGLIVGVKVMTLVAPSEDGVGGGG